MDRSLVFATPHLESVRVLAARAEEAGFARAWLTEYTDRDAIVRATAAGCWTRSLEVGTGISYSFTRHPIALAVAALDAHEATGGRFTLGLGTGTGGMRRRWFGLDMPRPVESLRETVTFLRAFWQSDGEFEYRSDRFSSRVSDLHLRERLEALPPLRIMGSGLGPGMVTAAASWCDGLLLHPIAVGIDYERRTLHDAVAAGLAKRSVATPFRQVQWVITSVHPDAAVAELLARRSLAFYLSARSYAPYFSQTRWESVQQAVFERFRETGPDWSELGELVPPEMAGEFCLFGGEDAVREQALRMQERLADRDVAEIVFQVSTIGLESDATEQAMERVISALAPATPGASPMQTAP